MAPAPVAVSPLIKFARYSALLVGIAYGSRHNSTLGKEEISLQDVNAKFIRSTLEKREGRLLEMKAKAKEAQDKKAAEVAAKATAGASEGSIFD